MYIVKATYQAQLTEDTLIYYLQALYKGTCNTIIGEEVAVLLKIIAEKPLMSENLGSLRYSFSDSKKHKIKISKAETVYKLLGFGVSNI